MLARLGRLCVGEKAIKSYQCVSLRHGTSIPVILVNDFEQKGRKGEEIVVKRGFARNFLIPRKIAGILILEIHSNVDLLSSLFCVLVYATAQNKVKFQVSGVRAAASKQDQSSVVALLRALGGIHIAKAASESGSLYAGVSAEEVRELLAGAHKVAVTQVHIAEPIKAVGDYVINVEGVELKLKVASS